MTKFSLHFCFMLSALVLSSVGQSEAKEEPQFPDPAKLPKLSQNNLPLIFSENFESGRHDQWEPTDASAWKVIQQGENHVLNLNKKRSAYEPPVRSPYNRMLLKDVNVGSFVLDVHLQSTHPDYNHRDLCLFFGYQDNAHLYYVHLGQRMDPHANNIFVVNNEPRKSISLKTTEGTPWDHNWHHARIVRDVKEGTIKVYFDDMKTPAMQALDKNFTWGRVGVGSFDDVGNFDNILLYGEVVPQK